MLTYQLILTASLLSLCVAEEFCVTPTLPATQSSLRSCHTLDQYAQNTSLFAGHTNITLVFLEGDHNFSYDLTLPEVNQLTLRKSKVSEKVHVVNICIQATHLLQIRLSTLATLYISDVTISRGVYNLLPVIAIEPEVAMVTLLRFNLKRIQLGIYSTQIATIIRECNLSSIIFLPMGPRNEVNIDIMDTKFSGLEDILYCGVCIVGNFTGSSILPDHLFLTMNIQNSLFQYYQYDGGIVITPFKGESKITITNTQFNSNSRGLFMNFKVLNNTGKMVLSNAKFSNNSLVGLHILSFNEILMENCAITKSGSFGALFKGVKNISIVDSVITNTELGVTSMGSRLTIRNTVIQNNLFGVIIPSIKFEVEDVENITTFIDSCWFMSNTLIGIVLMNTPQGTVLQNCTLNENQGSAILMYQSVIELRGENLFKNNTAVRGGGLALYNSTVKLDPGSNTSFIDNTAREIGGAIYIANLPPLLPQFLVATENSEDLHTDCIK